MKIEKMKNISITNLLFLGAIIVCLTTIEEPYLKTICAAILVMVYGVTNSEGFQTIGFGKQTDWVRITLLSILSAIGILGLTVFVFAPVTEYFTNIPVNLSNYRPLAGNFSLLITNLTIGWLIGAFCEELIFRGFILKQLMGYLPDKINIVSAVIISSVFFGFLHSYQGITGQIITGIIGGILALLYQWNHQRIWMSIVTHGMINTLSMLMIYSGWIKL